MPIRKTQLLRLTLSLIAMSAVGTALYGFADNDEQEIAFSELPKVIQAALKGVDVDEVEVTMQDGKRVYEVDIEADDVELELTLSEDGRLLGVKIEDDDGDDEEEDGDDDEDDDD